jgi:hypothetical protein
MVGIRADVIFALTLWIGLSASLIIFNAAVLRTYRHPVALTGWHQVVSVALVLCIRLVHPQALATGDPQAGVPPLTVKSAIWLGLPVALCQSLGLVCGNAAIIYLTVAFCQMMKAWTPACVYASGCLMGTQKWSIPIVKCLSVITVGLMITSAGELKFHLLGFVLQAVALISEGLRLNFLEIRLKTQGYKLNPLTSVQVFAPMVGSVLLVAAVLFDRDAFDLPKIEAIGKYVFVANGLLAFALNLVIYLAIQRASGLIFALAGVIKDIMIIVGGFVFQGSVISRTQIVGYAIAIAGLQAYGIVSKAPDRFEDGVIVGLMQHFSSVEEEPAKRPSPVIAGKQTDEEADLDDRAELNAEAAPDYSSSKQDTERRSEI